MVSGDSNNSCNFKKVMEMRAVIEGLEKEDEQASSKKE